MGAAFPRPLSDRERSLLELLLAENFPGADELRAQARAVRAKGLWEDRASILLLEVTDPNAPRANVVHTVPEETKCGTPTPPQELLLFVKERLLRQRRGSSEAELGSVESCLDGPELGMQHVAVRCFGRERQTQPGGLERSAHVATPVVGQHEVIEYPHRDFMRSPRPNELGRGIGLYSAAASEGIQ